MYVYSGGKNVSPYDFVHLPTDKEMIILSFQW